MLMPTEQQRALILVHHAWDLRDEGYDDDKIVQTITEEGVPARLASGVPGLVDEAAREPAHDEKQRHALVERLRSAVEAEDFDGVSDALLEGLEDERTLHKMYEALEELLLSEKHEQGTVAAFGLSNLLGRGDWPMILALSHEDWSVRFRAAFGLGKMGKSAHNAIEPLETAAKDPDDYVRGAAVEALERIRGDNKPWWKFW